MLQPNISGMKRTNRQDYGVGPWDTAVVEVHWLRRDSPMVQQMNLGHGTLKGVESVWL